MTDIVKNKDYPNISGTHPRVEDELRKWLLNDAYGLVWGSDQEKANAWQKAASRLEKLARQLLEDELSEKTNFTIGGDGIPIQEGDILTEEDGELIMVHKNGSTTKLDFGR